MTLAVMLSEEDLFICDMAETYHVLDYKALPVKLLAVLASGLRENSRTKMKIAGANYIPPETIYPQMVDYLAMIVKMLSGNKKKINFLSDALFRKETEKTKGFSSGDDFDRAWKRLTGEQDG